MSIFSPEQPKLFYERPKIVNEDLDRLVGQIIGEFTLRETTRAGAKEHPAFVREKWNEIPLPIRPGQVHEEFKEVEVFASDAIAALAANRGAKDYAVWYWKELTQNAGLGETLGFDMDQGTVRIFE